MKNTEFNNLDEIFGDFSLTEEEMLCIRGGDGGEPIILPSIPPVRI
jgi:hypothetical protein